MKCVIFHIKLIIEGYGSIVVRYFFAGLPKVSLYVTCPLNVETSCAVGKFDTDRALEFSRIFLLYFLEDLPLEDSPQKAK